MKGEKDGDGSEEKVILLLATRADSLGRHFASAEILTFIAAFAHNFDARIISDTLRPDTQRPGLGVQQCKGEMMVELKGRSSS